ncbi:MAG: DUF2834 domain-containing protein [Pseudomonadales bacterium]|nr:DUF2834 domain-containing protein [Pseudomonadales bacterium]
MGVVLPYSQFLPWVMDHGLSPILLVNEIVESRISAFAWLDVVVSAIVLLTFAGVESRRLGMKNLWITWVATLTVGVSLGLPLFLLMREYHLGTQRKLEKEGAGAT